MRSFIANVVAWVVYAVAFTVKLVLAFIGLFVVPLTEGKNPVWGNNEHPVPPDWYKPESKRWVRDYYWRALRNPVNNMRYWVKERPILNLSGDANPDGIRTSPGIDSSYRFIRNGVFAEYWYMRRLKDNKFFEFRIGWKYGNSVPGFGVTFQLGVRSR